MRKRLYLKHKKDFDEEARKRGYPVHGTDNITMSTPSVLLMLMDHCKELEERIKALEN